MKEVLATEKVCPPPLRWLLTSAPLLLECRGKTAGNKEGGVRTGEGSACDVMISPEPKGHPLCSDYFSSSQKDVKKKMKRA